MRERLPMLQQQKLILLLLMILVLVLVELSSGQEQECFQSYNELKIALSAYLLDPTNANSDTAIKYGYPIGTWCTGNVNNMNNLFKDAITFNEDISLWNTSSVTSMLGMFAGCTNFNQNINTFDTSSVTDMSDMFQDCINFNQPLNQWNTGNVVSMNEMFSNATSFNQDISNWDTANNIDFTSMFSGASSFNQPIGTWNVSSGTNFQRMFESATSFNQDLSEWALQPDISIALMFSNATNFNQNLCPWNEHLIRPSTISLMFENTACPGVVDEITATPDFEGLTIPGPLCYDCGGIRITSPPKPTLKPLECRISNTGQCSTLLGTTNEKCEFGCYNFCNGNYLSCCTADDETECNIQCDDGELVAGCVESDRNVPDTSMAMTIMTRFDKVVLAITTICIHLIIQRFQ